jgi:hypothetical protein
VSADVQLWWPPAKVYGRYLTSWIAQREHGGEKIPIPSSPAAGIDVEVPLDHPMWPERGPLEDHRFDHDAVRRGMQRSHS